MNVPEDRRYTDQHEWALLEESGVRIGITDYAQEALEEITYVRLPEVGRRVAAHEKVADVDGTKTFAEVFTPLDGVVIAVNLELGPHPELVNSDPYGEGWFVLLEPDDPGPLDALLDAAAYRALIG